jgi:hypothetical protein
VGGGTPLPHAWPNDFLFCFTGFYDKEINKQQAASDYPERSIHLIFPMLITPLDKTETAGHYFLIYVPVL